MTDSRTLKQQIVETLDKLPDESIQDVVTYIEFLEYRLGRQQTQTPHYKPIALGGLWSGVSISDEDIADVRKDMWSGFEDREP